MIEVPVNDQMVAESAVFPGRGGLPRAGVGKPCPDESPESPVVGGAGSADVPDQPLPVCGRVPGSDHFPQA